MIILLPVFYIYQKVSDKLSSEAKRIIDHEGESIEFVSQTVSGIDIVKSYQLEDRFSCIYNNILSKIQECQNKKLLINNKLFLFSKGFNMLILLGLPFFSVTLYRRGEISLGAILISSIFFGQLLNAVNGIFDFLSLYKSSKPAINEVKEVFSYVENEDEEAYQSDMPIEKLSFKNIEFSYIPQQKILHGINLSFCSNTITALVGPSGCGKSTIINCFVVFINRTPGIFILMKML